MRKKHNQKIRDKVKGLMKWLKHSWFFKSHPILRTVLGFIIILFGILMIPAPGPGWPIVFVGVAMVVGIRKGKSLILRFYNVLKYLYFRIKLK